MPEVQFNKFMVYADFFYKCVGVEPYTKISTITQNTKSTNNVKNSKTCLSNFVFYSTIINLTTIAGCEVIYVLIAFATGEHIVEAIMTLSYIGFVIVGMSKLLFVYRKKRELSDFMRELCELFPKDAEQQENYRLREYLRLCSRVSLTFSLLYSLLIWTYNLFAIMQYLIYEKLLHLHVVGQSLPYTIYTPWNWQDHWSYWPLVVLQNVAGVTSAAGQISSDLLLCAVATQMIMHYDYIARRIEEYRPLAVWQEDQKFLSETIKYHERILRLSANMNDIFGTPLLTNFIVSSFVICFVGFQMTVGVAPDMFFKLMLFLFSSLCQAYLICHFGQLIVDASYGIAVAAYKQNWYNADVRYRKMLVFIIARAQKPAYLKATVFMQISRSTMTDLLQTSYKFFALLRTMYAK